MNWLMSQAIGRRPYTKLSPISLKMIPSPKDATPVTVRRSLTTQRPTEKLRHIFELYSEELHVFPARLKRELLDAADYNHDGYVDRNGLQKVLKIMDAELSGYVDRNGLRKVLKNMDAELSAVEISYIIDACDIDGCGKIRNDKFLELLP
eukprot:CAMPEP_0117805488 /NCGR_PEP_ID=MMETSP0948-20121206/17892_1 /TAXON_ID=44440 /ORGANISM="Chattonella subsalsa, Strain CCMP2191" /LENGTH=149 /DNA_ID=CAMNT_0005639561 /DNA_START=186 /DNA_END=635 /DNA_ORIENTATION=-